MILRGLLHQEKIEESAHRLQQAEQVAVCLVRSGQHDDSNEKQILVGTYLLMAGPFAAASIAPLLHCCCALLLSTDSKKKAEERASSRSSSSRNMFCRKVLVRREKLAKVRKFDKYSYTYVRVRIRALSANLIRRAK